MFSVKIIKDSISECNQRLTTFEITFPRIILAEVNTHRILSRNSASSRAIPVDKIIKRLLEDPFVPVYWGKNQKGMSAEEELSKDIQDQAVQIWLKARDNAIASARELLNLGVHKQITNRLLEPFMWQTALVTATSYDNLFNLRTHKDAQPEFQKIARLMKVLYEENQPQPIAKGDWHLALVREEELKEIAQMFPGDEFAPAKISAGRCCRVSYLTHDGRRDLLADYNLAENLINSGHMSPLEHQAQNMEDDHWYGNLQGWKQYRKFIPNEFVWESKL